MAFNWGEMHFGDGQRPQHARNQAFGLTGLELGTGATAATLMTLSISFDRSA